jgi:protein transport protein SEC61 subunit gamma-like protein
MNLDFDVEKRIRAAYSTLKLAKKSSKEDFKIHLKLVLLAMGAIGAIGFIIQFISSLIAISSGAGSGGR